MIWTRDSAGREGLLGPPSCGTLVGLPTSIGAGGLQSFCNRDRLQPSSSYESPTDRHHSAPQVSPGHFPLPLRHPPCPAPPGPFPSRPHGTHRRQQNRRPNRRRTQGRRRRHPRPQALPRLGAAGRGSRFRLVREEEGPHRRRDRYHQPRDPAAGHHHAGRAPRPHRPAQRRPRRRRHSHSVSATQAHRRAHRLPPRGPAKGRRRLPHRQPRQGRPGR